ncbi:hypothetical protein GCM10025792_46620 [Pseudonocardia tropica]
MVAPEAQGDADGRAWPVPFLGHPGGVTERSGRAGVALTPCDLEHGSPESSSRDPSVSTDPQTRCSK